MGNVLAGPGCQTHSGEKAAFRAAQPMGYICRIEICSVMKMPSHSPSVLAVNGSPIFYPQQFFADQDTSAREPMAHVAPHHPPDDAFFRNLVTRKGFDDLPVTDYCYPISDHFNFIEFVADDNA
jgi:hypothetical protein